MSNDTTTKKIEVRVVSDDPKALKAVADGMAKITANASTMASGMQILTNAFNGWIAFLGIRKLTDFSDAMQIINDRLVLMTGSQEGANSALAGIAKVAEETRSPVNTLGDVYLRMGTILEDTGIKQGTLLDVMKTLTNTFRLSGTPIEEASAGILALSKAFAQGEIKGRELKAILGDNVYLAELLRAKFGNDIFQQSGANTVKATQFFKLLFASMDDINKKAEQLTPTFGQTLTVALNNTKLSILSLNEQLGLSTKFAAAVREATDKFTLSIVALSAAVVALAVAQLPTLVIQLTAVGKAMLALASSNPVVAVLVGIGAIIIATNKDLAEFEGRIDKVILNLDELSAAYNRNFALKYDKYVLQLVGGTELYNQALAKQKGLEDSIAERRLKLAVSGLPDSTPFIDPNKTFKPKDASEGLADLKDILGEINTAFLAGTLSVEQYNQKLQKFELYKLTRQFTEGKLEFDKWAEGLDKFRESAFNQFLARGVINLQEYRQAISETKIDALTQKFNAGKITLAEYNKEIVKVTEQFSVGGAFRAGTQEYIDSVGTLSAEVAGGIKNVFSSLETSFESFIKTGKFNFNNFTQGVLDDLTKIIVRASIIKPLADALIGPGSIFAPSTGPTSHVATQAEAPNTAAHGAYFSNDIAKFATGGVFNSPTGFGFGQNKLGVLGEAGPEAILPLSRNGGGDLGVKASVTPVNITIVNNSQAEIAQRETTGPNGERQIEILIHNKVKEGLATGKFDKSMQQAYGLQRKGS